MEVSRNIIKWIRSYSYIVFWRICKIKGKKIRFNMDLKSNDREKNITFYLNRTGSIAYYEY